MTRDPKRPAPRHTPRSRPRVGDTYTDVEGDVVTLLEGPDVNGGVRIRDPYGNMYWTAGWGIWNAGVYTRRDARRDPRVGDTKQYAAPFDGETYTVTSVEPFAYESDTVSSRSRETWESDSGLACTWTCGDDGGAS